MLPSILKEPLKHNKSAEKQCHNSELKVVWKKEWQKSPHTLQLKQINSSLPSNKFLKLTSNSNISWKGARWLYQIHTNHFPLNVYLHRFKRMESASCPTCGHHIKNLQHFLLHCLALFTQKMDNGLQKNTKRQETHKLNPGEQKHNRYN